MNTYQVMREALQLMEANGLRVTGVQVVEERPRLWHPRGHPRRVKVIVEGDLASG